MLALLKIVFALAQFRTPPCGGDVSPLHPAQSAETLSRGR